MPLADDYTAILNFALHWRAQPTLGARLLYLLAAQDGDYKLLFDHAVVAIDLGLSGRLHLGVYVLVGDLLLLVVAWVLWVHTAPAEFALSRRLLLFAPVSFLLFQLNYAETLNWAMGGLQNLSVIAFAFLAIHLLLRADSRRQVAACAAALVACGANANGFLLLPIGAYLLVRGRAWTTLVLWCSVFTAMAAAYLYRFTAFPKHLVSLGSLLHFALSFVGGGVENMRGRPMAGASVVLGLAMLLYLAFALSRGIRRDTAFAFYASLWILLTAALVTLGRSGFGAEIALSGRYKIYSDLLLVFAYLFAIAQRSHASAGRQPMRRLSFAVLFTAIAMCAASDVAGMRLLQQRREQQRQHIAVYLKSGGAAPPMQDTAISLHTAPSGIELAARDTLNATRAEGIYALPSR